MATGNEELDQFKTQINLCDFAAAHGFELDRKQSSKASAVMRHANGDKIAVSKRASGHWVYVNTHGNDSGSVIDFVMSRKSLSLGQARKELRPWVNGAVSHRKTTTASVLRNASELMPVEKSSFSGPRTRSINIKDTYLQSRGIPWSVIDDPVFSNRIRVDERFNMVFPHWNAAEELCGFEIKNKNFTGFSAGGEKGLWSSVPGVNDNELFFCETAIDALSVAAIFGTSRKRFLSTAGQVSKSQVDCIRSVIADMPGNATIWLAFDNDAGGRRISEQVQAAIFESLSGSIQVFERFPPGEGNDWNDELGRRGPRLLPPTADITSTG